MNKKINLLTSLFLLSALTPSLQAANKKKDKNEYKKIVVRGFVKKSIQVSVNTNFIEAIINKYLTCIYIQISTDSLKKLNIKIKPYISTSFEGDNPNENIIDPGLIEAIKYANNVRVWRGILRLQWHIHLRNKGDSGTIFILNKKPYENPIYSDIDFTNVTYEELKKYMPFKQIDENKEKTFDVESIAKVENLKNQKNVPFDKNGDNNIKENMNVRVLLVLNKKNIDLKPRILRNKELKKLNLRVNTNISTLFFLDLPNGELDLESDRAANYDKEEYKKKIIQLKTYDPESLNEQIKHGNNLRIYRNNYRLKWIIHIKDGNSIFTLQARPNINFILSDKWGMNLSYDEIKQAIPLKQIDKKGPTFKVEKIEKGKRINVDV